MNVDPLYLNVEEWRKRYSPPPHHQVVLRWIHQGLIQPPAIKVGRRWYVPKDAEYVNPIADYLEKKAARRVPSPAV